MRVQNDSELSGKGCANGKQERRFLGRPIVCRSLGDAQDTPELAFRKHGNCDGAFHSSLAGTGSGLAGGVGLQVAKGDGFEAFSGKAGDPFAYRDRLNQGDDRRRDVDACGEVEESVAEHMDGARLAVKMAERGGEDGFDILEVEGLDEGVRKGDVHLCWNLDGGWSCLQSRVGVGAGAVSIRVGQASALHGSPLRVNLAA
jgi:hypothetical protein